MGTRNITRIVSGGALKCCQYGQWDGYPTHVGDKLMSFLSIYNLDAFQRALDRVTLLNCQELLRQGELDEGTELFFTGAPVTDELRRACKIYEEVIFDASRVDDERGLSAAEVAEARHAAFAERVIDELGSDVLLQYHAASRDTGCDVVDLIGALGAPQNRERELTLWCDDYIVDNVGDWQIEGVYELDFDARTLMMRYHGCEATISFEDAIALSPIDRVALCERLERIADEERTSIDDFDKRLVVTDRVMGREAEEREGLDVQIEMIADPSLQPDGAAPEREGR